MEKREKYQVLVVDENPLTRFAILSIVNLHPLLHVCEEAADARSARAAHVAERPHLVVLDIQLPHGDGIELVREFALSQPRSHTLVMSELTDSEIVRRAFRAGAQAYLSKKDEAAQLLCALIAVVSGNTYMSKIVSAALQADVRRTAPSRTLQLIGTLSDRELHIFRRIGKSQGASAIAKELSVSIKTIETHVGRIKEKLRLNSSEELHRAAERWWEVITRINS